MLALTRKPTAPQQMRELNDHAGYRAEREKLHSLTVELAAIEARKREALAAPAVAGADLAAEAIARLDRSASADPTRSERETARLFHAELVQREAIRIQRARVEEARSAASAAIVEQVRPEYAAILREMAAAIIELSKLSAKEATIRERLLDSDVVFAGAMPAVPLESSRLDVFGSRANRWFDELERDYGIACAVPRRLHP
jgi:hypothetical protein